MTFATRVAPMGVVAMAGPLTARSYALSVTAWRGAPPRVSFGSVLARQTGSTSSTSPMRPSGQAINRDGRLRPEARLDTEDALDPAHHRRAALPPPEGVSVSDGIVPLSHPASWVGAPAPLASPPASLEELIPALVRRIAWTGDRHRGSVRLELGAGELAGATLLVHADNGRVRVHMDAPPGADTVAWQQRISRRLASRGISADSVEVT